MRNAKKFVARWQEPCLLSERSGSKVLEVVAKAIIYPLLMYAMDIIFVKNKNSKHIVLTLCQARLKCFPHIFSPHDNSRK